ncbi:hypothetical protein QQX98_009489 [Neonectria punicea]|uniref:Uncharacterized protein n=1 Tax=Neonectria punicea TaxID=979145 RepID=A0ABR1GSI8_9HYPO
MSSSKNQTLENRVAILTTRLSEARTFNAQAQAAEQTLPLLYQKVSTLDKEIADIENKIAQLNEGLGDLEYHRYDTRLTRQVQKESPAAVCRATTTLKAVELEKLDLRGKVRVLQGEERSPTPDNPEDDQAVLNQLRNMTRANLKRKVQTDLFSVDRKRMRPPNEMNLASLVNPSLEGIHVDGL